MNDAMRFFFLNFSMKAKALSGALAVLLLAGGAGAQSLRLRFETDNPNAFIGSRPATIAAPQLVQGRTMLPLNDSVLLLGYHLTRVGDVVSVVGAQLSVDLQNNVTTIAGVRQEDGSSAVIGGKLYVSARVLAAALGGDLAAVSGGYMLTAKPRSESPTAPNLAPTSGTIVVGPEGAPPPPTFYPAPPQARFAADKNIYAPGERVIWTDFSFDPEGGGITNRRWQGREDVYWTPGTHSVSLQVTNGRGQQSSTTTRSIRVQGTPIDTPLGYGLRYGEIGDGLPDGNILNYPLLPLTPRKAPTGTLLFSDSPEKPSESGILYQDKINGSARLLAYHINGLSDTAKMHVTVRNLENHPISFSIERQGHTAPSRIEGILGQVTLLEYFSGNNGGRVVIPAGGMATIFSTPALNPGHGVSLVADMQSTGEALVSVSMLPSAQVPTPALLSSLPFLPLDGRHQRGTFLGSDRSFTTTLGNLPARISIGDGGSDPNIAGRDAVGGSSQRLMGNYGVLYDLEFKNTAGTAIALSPRGGLYRGAMRVTDGDISQVIKLPREGNALYPNQPQILWRAKTDTVRVQFMPANGSALPVNFVFYRLAPTAHKWYTP